VPDKLSTNRAEELNGRAIRHGKEQCHTARAWDSLLTVKKTVSLNGGNVMEKTVEKSKRGRVENLKPFQPGRSGNPSGRPKKAPISDALREVLRDEKALRRFAAAIFKQTLKGNVAAFKEICERVEGRVANQVELSGESGGSVEVGINAQANLVKEFCRIYGLESNQKTQATRAQEARR
jgi:hypothetical protein